MKRKLLTFFMSFAIILLMAASAQAASGAKQIGINYNNIILYVNGKVISVQPDEEPFIYKDRTFIPVRMVAEALNMNVEWLNLVNTVKITGDTAESTEIANLKLQLTQKDAEIQDLKSKITSLQGDGDDISDLESDLRSDFDELEDVVIEDISLDGDKGDIDVDIEVDLSDYEDEWEDLDDSDIEDWIEDLVGTIQDELSDDTSVDGRITDSDSDDVLVEFSQDGGDSLEVDFCDDDYRAGNSSSDAEDVEDSLDGDSFYVSNLRFIVSYINYKDDDSVSVYLDAYDSDASSEWDRLNSSTIKNEVIDIAEDIADTFEDDADISLDRVNICFYDEDQDLLDDFVYDVDDAELN